MKFLVSVKNEILGDSERIMTIEEISGFNMCAYMLAIKAQKDGKEHKDGMWSVIPSNKPINSERAKQPARPVI